VVGLFDYDNDNDNDNDNDSVPGARLHVDTGRRDT
jgi:hypothetical protein